MIYVTVITVVLQKPIYKDKNLLLSPIFMLGLLAATLKSMNSLLLAASGFVS